MTCPFYLSDKQINSKEEKNLLFPNVVKERRAHVFSSENWILDLSNDKRSSIEQKSAVLFLSYLAYDLFKNGVDIKRAKRIAIAFWVNGQTCQLCNSAPKLDDVLFSRRLIDFDHVTNVKHFGISDAITYWKIPIDAIMYELVVLTRAVHSNCHKHFSSLQSAGKLKHGEVLSKEELSIVRDFSRNPRQTWVSPRENQEDAGQSILGLCDARGQNIVFLNGKI